MPVPKFSSGLVLGIPSGAAPLDASSSSPIGHYKHLANGAWNLLVYVRRHLNAPPVVARTYEAARTRHLDQLAGMCLLGVIEAFERYFKEVAAVCVDALGQRVMDDRLDVLEAKPSAVPQHFAARSFGSALCESLNWSSSALVNERFRRILADEDNAIWEEFPFPSPKQKPVARRRFHAPLQMVWQLRHVLVHNAGVISPSDAVKLRVLADEAVDGARRLRPTKNEVYQVKLLLDEAVVVVNSAVRDRLQVVLDGVCTKTPTVTPALHEVQRLASAFDLPFTVLGVSAAP
ncbi:MAG: hypothetical protein M9894_09605 [Planctomycetes bacterium]|nr:hypothetical protein [Planctomycetota bacterium]